MNAFAPDHPPKLDPFPQRNISPVLPPLTPPPPPGRRSTRISKPPNCLSRFTTLDSVFVPSSYLQAKDISSWQDVVIEELLALESNQTRDLVP